jgi:hypothetical protein
MATTTRWMAQDLKYHSRTLAAVALMGGLLGGCGGAEAPAGAGPVATASASASALTESRHANPNPALFEKDARPYGRSMEFWAEQWWRWMLSIPAAVNPILNPTLDSNQNQSGPVFFLGNGDRTNTVPRGRAIGVAPSPVENDYPCPDPTFQPPPGQSLFDFLMAGVEPIQNAVVEVGATLDGQVLTDLMSYRYASDDLMYFVGDLSLQATLDSCITGSRQPAVVDAFMFIIKPLEPGRHVLTTRVVNTAGRVFAHTQNLDVQ